MRASLRSRSTSGFLARRDPSPEAFIVCAVISLKNLSFDPLLASTSWKRRSGKDLRSLAFRSSHSPLPPIRKQATSVPSNGGESTSVGERDQDHTLPRLENPILRSRHKGLPIL